MVMDTVDNVQPVFGMCAMRRAVCVCEVCGAVCAAGVCLQAVYTAGGMQQTVYMYAHQALHGGCVYSRWCTSLSVCACVYVSARFRQRVWGVVRTAAGMHLMGCAYSKQPGLNVSSVWCCGRSEMLGLGSLSLEPHRISAQIYWSAGTAGQR